MPIAERLMGFLNQKGIAYEVIPHPKRYTALETAEAEHISGHKVAKAVMVKVDGRDAMFVIPADRRLDLFKLSFGLGTRDLIVEEEPDFERLFFDCERGAMPALGPLYGIPCYVDGEVLENKTVVFNAGSHEQSIRITTKDFLVLAEAAIGDFCVPK